MHKVRYVVYGAGYNVKAFVKRMKFYANVYCIIDNDINKANTKIEGIEVKLADEWFKNQYKGHESFYKILVSVTNPDALHEIDNDLKDRGLEYSKDYFFSTQFFFPEVEFQSPFPGICKAFRTVPEGYTARKSFATDSYIIRNKGNEIYRIILGEDNAKKYKKIYEICNDNRLFGSYIVDTSITNQFSCYKDNLVFKHKYLPRTEMSFEFSEGMYSDYVYWMLEFADVLTDCGLGLPDAHGRNATIYNGHFIFYDFGSFDLNGYISGRSIQQIIEYIVLPLVMMKKGQQGRAYMYLKNDRTMMVQDIVGYITESELEELKGIYEDIIYVTDKKSSIRVIDRIKKFIDSITARHETTTWNEYQDFEWKNSSNIEKWSTKMQNADYLLNEIDFRTVTDLAGNQGWYSVHLMDKIDNAVVVDTDQDALNRLWQRIQDENISNVYPVYMSITSPSLPEYWGGLVDGKSIKPISLGATDRYKSEVAIALSIVHHLAFRMCLNFDEIINLVGSFTSRYLLIEFIDQTDQYISDWIKDGYEWYTRENFEKVLKRSFKIIEQKESTPEETRTLYLCEKL